MCAVSALLVPKTWELVHMQTLSGPHPVVRPSQSTIRRRLYWTLGNLLMVAGIYLLFYVGGVFVQIEYQRLAARGDSDLELIPPAVSAPAPAARAAAEAPPPIVAAAAPAFSAPNLNGQIASPLPSAAQLAHVSTVERLVIPSVAIDSKVVEVGWSIIEQNGQQAAVWDVAEFAVGQHRGSANPGEGDNIVLAGHVGGYGQVFRDLFYVRPGDQVVLYSGGQQFLYVVEERLVVEEEGAPLEQRIANAQMIAPTGREMITMVTCWPATGPDKFSQRVIVRAVPFGATAPLDADSLGAQTIR
jgi:LPXTG-site transpeptidase (sortase) family protein